MSDMFHLPNTYPSSIMSLLTAIKKNGIHNELLDNIDIVITKPDQINGVVVLHRSTYQKKMSDIQVDISNFGKDYCYT